MSFLSGLFGNNGSNYQAQSAQVTNPLAGGAGTATSQSQNAIQQQQALANAIAQAGGVQNQQNVYNQLGQIASGQGPNPAAAMLAQQTGANVAQTAALQAGQRGASQNVGLLARQAGQQGAATQQQAVGQGATLQAQQALGALGQQSGIASQQVGNQLAAQNALTGAAQTQAGQLIGANVAQNQANLANTQQQNQYNEQIANTNAQGQQNLLGSLTGTLGGALTALAAHGGMVHHYASGGGITDFGGATQSGNVLSSFGQSLSGSQPSSNPFMKGSTQIGSALGTGLKSLFSSSSTPTTDATMANTQANSPLLSGNAPAPSYNLGVTPQDANASTQGAPSLGVNTQFSKGGKVPAMVSPGEKYLPPSEVKKVEKGEKAAIHAGHTIHGKAKVPGDSLKNDTVPKTLEEGGIVLPRSVTQSKNPGPAAQKFVEALLSKQKAKRAQ